MGPGTPGSKVPTLGRVNAAVASLYGEVDSSDAVPTGAQTRATAATEQQASVVLKSWEDLRKDLPTLNSALHDANLPEVNVEASPTINMDEGDEE